MPKNTIRNIQAEDLYELQPPGGVRLSPDGELMVLSLPRVERKSEKKFANLWIAAASPAATGDTPRQFTFGDQRDTAPQWSPDGSWIAFLSNRGDPEKPPQLYRIPLAGGEARRLAELPGEIGDFAWSPDGKRIACTLRKFDPDRLERMNDEQKKKLGVVERRYERLFYKLDGYGYLPHERWHLWIVDVASGKARQVSDHAVFDEQQPAWSPDGKLLAFVSNRAPDPDAAPEMAQVWVMPAGGGEMRCVSGPALDCARPSFAPDGRRIAWYGSAGVEWYRNNDVWTGTLDGSQTPCNLTAAYDLHAAAGAISDINQPESQPPAWSPDGQRLYFAVSRHGSAPLVSVAADGSDLRSELDGAGTLNSYSFDRRHTRLGCCYVTLDEPGQAYVKDLPSGELRSVTTFNRALLKHVDLGQVTCHWIQGPDGNHLQGWILTPPGFDPAQRYPSVLQIHGGPLTQYGYAFMHEFYYLAAQGFVVSFCNPRGGRGYGEQHGAAIWGAWGTVDYADLMAWADYVASQPYIDPQRMGVCGGSYGGYMTAWIIGHTTRFKAAVAMRCVSNFVSMWGSSDMNWSFQQAVEAGAPFEDLHKHWDRSPMKYIG
ncbi:MAG: prolyl oligopeptidase family serine peptidase, partial [Chloroflexota bacterium]